jgi:aspartyl-tRNA(Asn)/glutamyl-tRNA(Gln) amidotransferase subunit A
VAAGTVPASLGSDTGGSIRQPAALCGVHGLKPTWGRVSRRGLVAFASSLDVVGPLARDVATLAAVYRAIAGPDPGDATSVDRVDPPAGLTGDLTGLRVGVASSLCRLDGVAPVMAERLAETAAVCAAAGAEVREVTLPDPRDAVAAYYVIAPAEASSNLARFDGVRYGLRVGGDSVPAMMAATRSAGFGAEVKRRILLGTFVLAAGYATRTYRRAQALRITLREEFAGVFAGHDLVLTPVTPTTAFPLGATVRDPMDKYLADLFTVTANLLGAPAVAVPTGEDEGGRPVGMQFLAPPFAEERLLAAAAAVERSGRWPVPGAAS